MNKSPLVSIVLTSYNHQEYLEQALDGIFSQTYSNVEVIIVDDCSTDGSQEILRKYKNKFPAMQLQILKKNTGSYVNSSNYGASLATGDYINFAQCDDFSQPNQIERLVNVAKNNPEIGIVYSRSFLVDFNGNVISDDFENREYKFRRLCSNDTYISGAQMFEFLTYSCVIPNLSAALIKRDLFNSIGGLSTKYKVAADWAFWMDMSFITNFYYISEPLNFFRQHSTTIRNTIKFESQILELFEIFYSIINTQKLSFYQEIKLYVGANIIWISGMLFNKKIFKNTFFSIFKQVQTYNKYNILYFFICLLKVIKEASLKRLVLLLPKFS